MDVALTRNTLEKIFISVNKFGYISSKYELFIRGLREEFIDIGDMDLLNSLDYLSSMVLYKYSPA